MQISPFHTQAPSPRELLGVCRNKDNSRLPGERGAVPADAAEGGQVVRGAGARLRQRHQEGHRRRRGEGGQGAAVEGRRTEVQQFY